MQEMRQPLFIPSDDGKIPCPDCEAEVDYEIGPGESLEDVLDTAVLLQRIEGEEEVEKMDALLSLAITGGDFDWI